VVEEYLGEKVVVLDREEAGARGTRDEEEREARRRQAWTCSGVIVERVADSRPRLGGERGAMANTKG
jgi:hypothetical protein